MLKKFIIDVGLSPRGGVDCLKRMKSLGEDTEIFWGYTGRQALDLNVIGLNRDRFKGLWGRECTMGEVGCYASHISLARRFLSYPTRDGDWYLVFEDDAFIEEGFSEKVESYLREAESRGITYLNFVRGNGYLELEGVQHPKGRIFHTCAYAMHRVAAFGLASSYSTMISPIDEAIMDAEEISKGILSGPNTPKAYHVDLDGEPSIRKSLGTVN